MKRKPLTALGTDHTSADLTAHRPLSNDHQALPQLFYLVGPTASGKSEAAVKLAERTGAEIVGADAFQIYQGLDILSAKPGADLLARVPHHLIGIVPLADAFDVAKYRTLALAAIAGIHARGKPVIVCGGAGFYIRALTHGLPDELPSPDPKLRAELEKEPLAMLAERLRQLDPQTRADMNNPRRVIRALEVCIRAGRPFSSFAQKPPLQPVHAALFSRPKPELEQRILSRTRAMFAAGVVEEVRNTPEPGPTASQMLGLREIRAHIAGKMTLDACIAAVALTTRQYAKRQLTWFRREQWPVVDATPGAIDSLACL